MSPRKRDGARHRRYSAGALVAALLLAGCTSPSDEALSFWSFTGIQLSSQVLTDRTDLRERVTFMWATLLPSIVPPRRLHRFNPAGNLEEQPA